MKLLLAFWLLTAAVWAEGWPASEDFPEPRDLRRAATDLRLNLSDLGPVQFGVGQNFGPGFGPGDLNRLGSAISYFERACLRVEDPRETLAEYRRLRQAYDRAWRAQPYGTPSVRDITLIMQRLEKFYRPLLDD